jgi:hypothetical protein
MSEADDVRIEATDAAHDLLVKLQRDHGDILLHQSGGCCDGSAPMCYPQKEFRVGQRDVLLGTLSGVPFYVGGEQYRVWKDWFVTLDAKPGRAGIFSLEGSEGLRFVTTVRPLAGTTAGEGGATAPGAPACAREPEEGPAEG